MFCWNDSWHLALVAFRPVHGIERVIAGIDYKENDGKEAAVAGSGKTMLISQWDGQQS